jgi:hypothetical protein
MGLPFLWNCPATFTFLTSNSLILPSGFFFSCFFFLGVAFFYLAFPNVFVCCWLNTYQILKRPIEMTEKNLHGLSEGNLKLALI